MKRYAVTAGLAYGALVFAAGFVLGAVRLLLLAPQTGALAATLIELPVILAIAWFLARWLVGAFRVEPSAGSRLAMGAIGLALLLALEIAMGMALMGRSLTALLADYGSVPAQIGLLGQLAFAAFPWAQGRLGR